MKYTKTIIFVVLLTASTSCSILEETYRLNIPDVEYQNEKLDKAKSQERSFSVLYQKIINTNSDNHKLQLLYNYNKPLFTRQAYDIMNSFYHDQSKIEALQLILPQLIDKKYADMLCNTFVYVRYSQEAKNIIQNYTEPIITKKYYSFDNKGYEPWGKSYRPIDNIDFENLLHEIKTATFKDEKNRLIRVAAHSGYFTCEQCSRLMSIFTFDSDKMFVCNMIVPKILDPQNSYKVIRSLSFISSKEKAEKLFNKYFD